ncbi:hypothetical protein [Liquorilactobacillus sicerae]|uniref:hypothetical protein n=1 Tax=Liquorilactobacillus sicerae TaxID=1416943 RepID=UPI002480CC9B|nr:hypothetical protein [Liquorilactobacillus sicerae]
MNKTFLTAGEFCLATTAGWLQCDIRQQLLPKTRYLIITELSPHNLQILQQALPSQLQIWLSYDLLHLLQKMKRFELFDYSWKDFKLLPNGYPQFLGATALTAYANDDSRFGSLALLLEQNKQRIGYCRHIAFAGPHKKRIKRWKKALQQAQINYLLLDQTMTNLPTVNHFENEAGLLHHWEKYLNHHPHDISLALSPWNPERLGRYAALCQAHQRQLFLQPAFGKLLEWSAPRKYHWQPIIQTKQQDSLQTGGVYQVDEYQSGAAKQIWLDPALDPALALSDWQNNGLQTIIPPLTPAIIETWQNELQAEIKLI